MFEYKKQEIADKLIAVHKRFKELEAIKDSVTESTGAVMNTMIRLQAYTNKKTEYLNAVDNLEKESYLVMNKKQLDKFKAIIKNIKDTL